MTETINTAQSYKNVSEALLGLYAENLSVPCNSIGTVDGSRYMYANLEDQQSVIKPALLRHGLFLTSYIEYNFFCMSLEHPSSGTQKISKIEVKDYANVAKLGAQITLYRRYLTAALLDLVLDKSIPKGEETIVSPDETITTDTGNTTTIHTDESKIVATRSQAYKNAVGALAGCATDEVLEIIKGKITNSDKLSDEEKDELLEEVKKVDTKINGTIYV